MNMISDDDVAGWRYAIGRSETVLQRLKFESLRRYAFAAGSTPDVEREPPPLAHWAFFLRAPAPRFPGQPVRFRRSEGEVRAVRCDGAVSTVANVTRQ